MSRFSSQFSRGTGAGVVMPAPGTLVQRRPTTRSRIDFPAWRIAARSRRRPRRRPAWRGPGRGSALPQGKDWTHLCASRGGEPVPLHEGLLTGNDSGLGHVRPYRFGARNRRMTDLCRLRNGAVSRGPFESSSDIRYLPGPSDSFPTIQWLTTTFSV